MNPTSFTALPKKILNLTKNKSLVKYLQVSLGKRNFHGKKKISSPLLSDNSTTLQRKEKQQINTSSLTGIKDEDFNRSTVPAPCDLHSEVDAKSNSLKKTCNKLEGSFMVKEQSRLPHDEKKYDISKKDRPIVTQRVRPLNSVYTQKLNSGGINCKNLGKCSNHLCPNKCSSSKSSMHTSTRHLFRKSRLSQSTGPNFNSQQKLLDSVSSVVGDPNWNSLVRDAILDVGGKDSEHYLDVFVFPFIEEHVTDVTTITEGLIVLLLAKMAGLPPSLTDEKNSGTVPSDGHFSIATSMMMLRIILRLHCQTDIDSQPDGEAISNLDKLYTLMGDMMITATFAKMSSLGRPLVFSIFFRAFSDSVTSAFIECNNGVQTSDSESSYKLSLETKDAKGEVEANQQLYQWENTPGVLGRLCECAITFSGFDPKLQAAAKKFGNNLSYARKTVSGIKEDTKKMSDVQTYLLTAMNHLQVFPDNQEKELMEKLVRNYIGESQA